MREAARVMRLDLFGFAHATGIIYRRVASRRRRPRGTQPFSFCPNANVMITKWSAAAGSQKVRNWANWGMRYRTWTGNETDRWSRVDGKGSEDNHPLRQCARVENRVRCYIYTRGMNLPISSRCAHTYIAESFQLSRSYMFYMAVNADVKVTSRNG